VVELLKKKLSYKDRLHKFGSNNTGWQMVKRRPHRGV